MRGSYPKRREDRHVKTLYIEPGSPWQNGHVESFHGSLRDECLDRELMLSVAEARVLIEDYRRHYNEERPHGAWATARPRRRSPKPKLWTAKRQIPCPPLDPPTKTATRITNPNLSPVLDQSRGLDQPPEPMRQNRPAKHGLLLKSKSKNLLVIARELPALAWKSIA